MSPKSHQEDIFKHHDCFEEDNILTRRQTIEDIQDIEAQDVTLQAGQISMHHVRTIHSSTPNHSQDRPIGLALQSFFSTSVCQTLGEDYALLMRGKDPDPNFLHARRPLSAYDPEGAKYRMKVNQRFSEILYHGADQKRAY